MKAYVFIVFSVLSGGWGLDAEGAEVLLCLLCSSYQHVALCHAHCQSRQGFIFLVFLILRWESHLVAQARLGTCVSAFALSLQHISLLELQVPATK